jgi:Domain of unknown function (DUF5666)
MKCQFLFVVSLIALLLGLSGCGKSPSVTGIEGSGINTGPVLSNNVTSAGAVTDLGSIFVNGVEYELADAVITVDGNPATEADIDVGSIVIVEGSLDEGETTGTANRVTAGIALAGPIASIDPASNRFVLFGQIVELDPFTTIENAVDDLPLRGLAVGDDIEVTGFADSTGMWTARRIVPRLGGTPLRLTGRAANIDANGSTFTIGGQTVNYASAALVGFGAEQLEGAPVRVIADAVDANDVMLATEVFYRDLSLPGDVGDRAALQGWVTRFASVSDFDVDGHPVVTTATTFLGGAEGQFGEVRLDAFVNVEGRLIDGGVVEATEVRQNTLVSLDSVIWYIDNEFISGDLTDFYGYRCRIEPTTVVVIDGLPKTFADLVPGDVATIYEHHPNDGTPAHCQIIAVEHNIRGPIESMPTDSASMIVMGQRVWLDTSKSSNRYFDLNGFEYIDQLSVGDIVEVSGHTTAAGDILAKTIHAAVTDDNYRVIGLARDVDTTGHVFRVGALTINYASASVGGFENNVPAEGDRVLVLSDYPPDAGVLTASIVRYEAGIPRGATGAVIKLNGVITRFVSPADFDVEGRRTTPTPTQYDPAATWSMRCDMDKLHTDMRFERLVAVESELGEVLYFRAVCMFGRRLDSRGYDSQLFDEPQGLYVSGPVQSIDLANRSFMVAGVNLMLLPDTLLTQIEEISVGGDDFLITTPVFLEDLTIGGRVIAKSDALPSLPGIRPAAFVWLGNEAPLPAEEVSVTADIFDKAEPTLVLESGIEVQVPTTTVIEAEGCSSSYAQIYSVDEFWERVDVNISRVTVYGFMSSDQIVATRLVFLEPDDADCN